MPSVISSGGQTRFKNSYASSAEAKLTLRVNGEEKAAVITPQGAAVQAGFDAPTTDPVASSGGAGNVPEGYYVYRYAYASSRYPFVDNDVAADGELWPRSSPSDASNTFQVTGGTKQVSVSVAYTTRSDVDWILLYRTRVQTSSTLAAAQDDAGQLFFVEKVANNTAGGTTSITDNNVSDTGEAMDLDNYTCPLFRYTVFDGFYWWGFGNTTLTVVVTLDGTSTFSIDTSESDVDQWFSGRDGYTISFVGITTGGYDGRGNYYFERVTATTGQAFVGSDLVTPTTLPATGTTTAYLTAPTTTLYRSKRLNPFSWGRTTEFNDGTKVPELYAERIGGGVGSGISLIPNERILKLDTEGPQKSYALDLNAADDGNDFIGTLRTLDEAQSTSSHFSQYPMRDVNGQTTLTSVNAKALQLLSADGQSQIPLGDNVRETLSRMVNDGTNPDFYHGAYDYGTELNCWFIKTTDSPYKCDTLLYMHAPSGKWGIKYIPISASGMIYDAESRDHLTLVGDEHGRIGILFQDADPDVSMDWERNSDDADGTATLDSNTAGVVTVASLGTGQEVVVTNSSFEYDTASLAATSGEVFIGRRFLAFDTDSNDAYVVIVTATDPNDVTTFYVNRGDSLFNFELTYDFSHVPVAMVKSDLSARYVGLDWNTITFTSVLNGVLTLAVAGAPNSPNCEGINIDTGEYETIIGTYTLYIAATLTSAQRSFSVTPDTDKRVIESWATMQNVGESRFRYLYEFGSSLLLAVEPTRDVTGALNGSAYTVKTPASTLMRSFTVDIQDAGYANYRLMNFTHKIQSS